MLYKQFQDSVPKAIADSEENNECKPFHVQLAIEPSWTTAKRRILFVLEYVDKEDINRDKHRNPIPGGKPLTGPSGSYVPAAIDMARKQLHRLGKDTKFAAGFIHFNSFKTYHLAGDQRQIADTWLANRIKKAVRKLNPDTVMVIGDGAARYLIPDAQFARKRGWCHEIDGRKWFSTISLHAAYGNKSQDAGDEDDEAESALDVANLLGYVSRHIANAINGDLLYKIKVNPSVTTIDTMVKWKKLLAALQKKKVWAYDTEDDNLNRIENRILTMQFAFNTKRGYIVPLNHADSPFNEKQIQEIKKDCHALFSKRVDPLNTDYDRFIVGQNLKFDMTVTRNEFSIYQVHTPIWDLMAGEFCLDENIKALAKSFGTGQYGLEQIALNYGCSAYMDNEFGKHDRGKIAKLPLKTPGLKKYMVLDVCLPMAIHRQQLERSKNIPHTNVTGEKPTKSYYPYYRKLVLTQMSNIQHVHSTMEHRGSAIDVKWLHELKRSDGPLQKEVKELRSLLYKQKSVKRANANLLKESGAPAGSLYGDAYSGWVLKLSKPQHKRELFINVLKLKPLATGKLGDPKIDKAFFKQYKEVPEVAQFSAISEIDKLLSTYVTPFLRKLKSHPDFRKTLRLNPSYGYLDVVTGRGNSSDPNLQNIPTRGKKAKLIKRMFVAAVGRLKIKMDYSSHEVRKWSTISGDRELGKLFDTGRALRRKWVKTGNRKYLPMIDTLGDIHIQNVSFFFGIALNKIKKVHDKEKDDWEFPKDIAEKRNAVKSIVFGAIYGRSARAIAGQINKPKEYVEKLLPKFFKRFPKASNWLNAAKKQAVEHCFVSAPTGRRRNLYAHLFGINSMVAAVERRGSNAPIQGIASDMGHTSARIFGYHFEKFCLKFGFTYAKLIWDLENNSGEIGNIEQMVHDALVGDFPYALVPVAYRILQWCATIGCMEWYNKHFGIKFTTYLEVDFEIGASDDNLKKLDWSEDSLRAAVKYGLEEQNKIYPIDVAKRYKQCFSVYDRKDVQAYLNKHYPVLSLRKDLML